MVSKEDDESDLDRKEDQPNCVGNGSRRLMKKIRKKQKRNVGHILRGESSKKHYMMGMIEGNRARRRQRMKYLGGIKTLVGLRNVGKVVRQAEDREG